MIMKKIIEAMIPKGKPYKLFYLFFIILSLGTSSENFAQESNYKFKEQFKCEQNALSKQFNLAIETNKFHDAKNDIDSTEIILYIKDKKTSKVLSKIIYSSTFLLSDDFLNCDSLVSFTTKFNSKKEIIDSYIGDLVIDDLNFDGLDDILVVKESGGSSGPIYNFYIQSKGKKFVLDKYLTETVMYFPYTDKKTKTITSYSVGGVCYIGERTFKYNMNTKKWILKESRNKNICDD